MNIYEEFSEPNKLSPIEQDQTVYSLIHVRPNPSHSTTMLHVDHNTLISPYEAGDECSRQQLLTVWARILIYTPVTSYAPNAYKINMLSKIMIEY